MLSDVLGRNLGERLLRLAFGKRGALFGLNHRDRIAAITHDRSKLPRRLPCGGKADGRKAAEPHLSLAGGDPEAKHPALRPGFRHLKTQAINTTHAPSAQPGKPTNLERVSAI